MQLMLEGHMSDVRPDYIHTTHIHTILFNGLEVITYSKEVLTSDSAYGF